MRKEDLRLAAGLTTNMIANMGKGEHISMKTLLRICEALNCEITDVIELVSDEPASTGGTVSYTHLDYVKQRLIDCQFKFRLADPLDKP